LRAVFGLNYYHFVCCTPGGVFDEKFGEVGLCTPLYISPNVEYIQDSTREEHVVYKVI